MRGWAGTTTLDFVFGVQGSVVGVDGWVGKHHDPSGARLFFVFDVWDVGWV